jgi:hypothetical protein
MLSKIIFFITGLIFLSSHGIYAGVSIDNETLKTTTDYPVECQVDVANSCSPEFECKKIYGNRNRGLCIAPLLENQLLCYTEHSETHKIHNASVITSGENLKIFDVPNEARKVSVQFLAGERRPGDLIFVEYDSKIKIESLSYGSSIPDMFAVDYWRYRFTVFCLR